MIWRKIRPINRVKRQIKVLEGACPLPAPMRRIQRGVRFPLGKAPGRMGIVRHRASLHPTGLEARDGQDRQPPRRGDIQKTLPGRFTYTRYASRSAAIKSPSGQHLMISML